MRCFQSVFTLVFAFIVCSACGDAAAPADDTSVVITEAAYAERQVWLSVGEEAPRFLARDGSGPGELRAPIAFGSDGNGQLLVYDIARIEAGEMSWNGTHKRQRSDRFQGYPSGGTYGLARTHRS